MSRAKKPRLQRDKLIEIIVRRVRRLQRENSEKSLGRVEELLFECLGWQHNSASVTHERDTLALYVLAPLANDDELEQAAHTAIWRHEMDKGADDKTASATARKILEPLGVLFAECGCMVQFSGDSCCNRAVEIRDVAKKKIAVGVDRLANESSTRRLDQVLALVEKMDGPIVLVATESKVAA